MLLRRRSAPGRDQPGRVRDPIRVGYADIHDAEPGPHGMDMNTVIKNNSFRRYNVRTRQLIDLDAWEFYVGRYATLELSLIHISEPTRLLSISYAVFCLKKKKKIPEKWIYI
eukprot:TRINITY_DN4547_c0_g1_i4.p3 TRINITY_DN4547_c0_g1~~TRINITY_DN4547_c0_g1_i4.p3  ORF type:complete len:112 (+),score=16.91 TRINITY_DN4547_c0_g1_i4:435-770(+)